jgi:hypothetical protein
MLKAIDAAITILAPWPIVQGFFVIVIAFMGYLAVRRGDRDRDIKFNNNIEIPAYIMAGPVHDALITISSMAEEMRNINVNLTRQLQILEFIRNNQEMRSGSPIVNLNAPRNKRDS